MPLNTRSVAFAAGYGDSLQDSGTRLVSCCERARGALEARAWLGLHAYARRRAADIVSLSEPAPGTDDCASVSPSARSVSKSVVRRALQSQLPCVGNG